MFFVKQRKPTGTLQRTERASNLHIYTEALLGQVLFSSVLACSDSRNYTMAVQRCGLFRMFELKGAPSL